MNRVLALLTLVALGAVPQAARAQAAVTAPPVVKAEAPPPDVEGEVGRSDTGGAGLNRVRSAFVPVHGLAVSMRGSFFRIPALTASGGVDEFRQTEFGASFAPVEWAELSATLRSNTLEQLASPAGHYYLVNDFFLRGKFGTTLLEGALALAGDVWVRLPPPVLRADPLWKGTSPGIGLVASYDLQRHGAPIVFHLNTGFSFDESVRFDDGSGDVSRRFALDITTWNVWKTGLAVEGRFRAGGVGLRPFVEYALDTPMGAKGPMPMRLAPGLRVLPWKGLVIDGIMELGLSKPTAAGVLPVPGWQATVALGYQASLEDQVAKTEIIERVKVVNKEVVKEVPKLPTHGTVQGKITDAVSKEPIGDAILSMKGRDRVLANPDGTFTVKDADPGPTFVSVSKTGYAPKEVPVTIEVGKTADASVELVALPPPPPAPMTVRGTVLSEGEQPVQATVAAPSAGVVTKADKAGMYELSMPSGIQPMEISAAGFQTQGRQVSGRPGETVVMDVVLKPVPKQLLVVLKKEKIEIKKQVHFATAKDVILPDSAPLLDQIASVIMENDRLKLIRIEGHTDSEGDDAYNLDLSERRAKSVMRALLERGIEPGRLKAVGYGETQPIADNKKAAGRALNRRVEFMIEQQE